MINTEHALRQSYVLRILLLFLLSLLSACAGEGSATATPTQTAATASPVAGGQTSATPTSAASIAATATATSGQYHVKVYFSRQSTQGAASPRDLIAVERQTSNSMVATFALQQLIQGPTPAEQKLGYYSQLQQSLTGTSSCMGNDFTLTLNKKGNVSEQGSATVRFCRQITSTGVASDAAIQSEVTQTLEQFSTIKKVVILTDDGHCFGDESGLDICLR